MDNGRIGRVGFLLVGIVLGVLLLGAARLLAMPETHAVHYHANWAIVVNGQRLDLSGDRYMEDVAQCSLDPTAQRPQDRVHMHENNPDIVHVHASGVTWGHLLANLQFGIGDDYLITEEARYDSGEGGTLKFIVNGRPVQSIVNRPVENEDRLLISFGPETEEQVMASQFSQVASTAGQYNTLPDPASCSGQHGVTLGEKVRRAFWF